MDIEALRLEREEKRRQRRERIRRILEDDDYTPAPRRTKEERETELGRTTRRTRENGTTPERTREPTAGPGESTVRSTRSSRLRENVASSSPRSSTRPRDSGTSTPVSERIRARSNLDSDGSQTRSTRTARSSERTDENESKLDSIRARREARRKRNQEHDYQQNKISAENGETGKADHSRITRNRKGSKDGHSRDISEDSKGDLSEKSGTEGNKGDIGGRGDDGHDKKDDVLDKGVETKEDICDKIVSADREKNGLKDTSEDESKLGEVDGGQERDISGKESGVKAATSEVLSDDLRSHVKEETDGLESVDGIDNSGTVGASVSDDRKDGKKDTGEQEQVDGIKNDSDVGKVDEKSVERILEPGGTKEDESRDKIHVELTPIPDELPHSQQNKISDSPVVEGGKTEDVSTENVETKAAELLVDTSPLESAAGADYGSPATENGHVDADNEHVGQEEAAPLTEDLPEISFLSEEEITTDVTRTQPDEGPCKTEPDQHLGKVTLQENAVHAESPVSGVPQGSENESGEILTEVFEEQKIAPKTSPRKGKLKTVDTKPKSRTKSDDSRSRRDEKNQRLRAKSDTTGTVSVEDGAKTDREVDAKALTKTGTKSAEDEATTDEVDTKSDKTLTKADVTRTKSAEDTTTTGEVDTKVDNTKRRVTRTSSAESGTKGAESGTKGAEAAPKTSRAGKLKISDDSWKKNVRKKRGVPDVDRAVELTVLGRTGKIKDKMKSCETRDSEGADHWKKEVKKTPRKHKSFDEETEKELRELSSKRELKNIVQSCEQKDKDSAEAWKREVKKTGRKHKSLDEGTESELREISKGSLLKARIKECEEKDMESAEAWKKEIKKGNQPNDSDTGTGVDEELMEFSGSGRLKDLITSCAERDDNREKSWESAKEKQKSKAADDEAELQELAAVRETKSKIIQQYEERDKESAEAGKKKIKSGEQTSSFDETTDEELRELATTVDVKSRIQSRIVEHEKAKDSVKRSEQLEDEELKEINLKGRMEAYKQESEKHSTEKKGRKSPSKSDNARKSPSKDIGQRGRTSPTKGDSGRVSPTKDRARSSSATSGRVSPSKDRSRTSSAVGDSSGRVSPTKDRSRTSSTHEDKSGRVSPTKDKGKTPGTKEGISGRASPSRDRSRTSPTKGDSGRSSPTKDPSQTGRISPSKRETGRTSPSKDATSSKGPAKSKLENIRTNLYEGSKNKTKNKRESLDRVKKSTNIKDKIAACKERDNLAPRAIALPKTPAKPKPKVEPDTVSSSAATESNEGGKTDEVEAARVPVNRQGENFTTVEDEIQGASIKGALSFWKEPGAEKKPESPPDDEQETAVDVDIKGRMTFWDSPKQDEDTTTGRDSPPKDSERPAPVILGTVKQGWQKRKRKLNAAEFIKELLSSNCKRRELKDIQDVKSETKKYLAGGMHAEETGASEKVDDDEGRSLQKNVKMENRKNAKKDFLDSDKKDDDEFSFDDVVKPDEVKQLSGFSNFRRQVRPTNRRAAKSNPVRKLQQRNDVKTEMENFDDVDEEDEEDAPLQPTAFGRLGRAIEPGDRKSRDANQFAADALAALAAKEDVTKITLKKTSKSKSGVSQEKSEHDGTAPVMLVQIKGHRHMQTRLVESSVDSLNSADSFILVTEKYLHVWNGKDSNVMKKSKASELSNKILQYKLLNCTASVVTIIKDGGVNVDTGLTRTFWNTLGGKKTLKGSKDMPKDGDYEKAMISSNVVYAVDTSSGTAKLEKMSELCGKIPKINMLDSNKAFVFDFGAEVYAWLGRTCDKNTRNKAVELGLDVYKSPFEVHNSLNPITPNMPKDDDEPRQLKRPSWALFGRMTERAETILFEQKFSDWPDVALKMKMDKEKDLLNKNLSKGYAKRMAKVEKSEFQAIELVPYDGAKMAEEPPAVKLILEGVNVGRGRGSYDEIERRSLVVTTNSVTVYHSSEKESRQLEEKEWGHFYSAESYVIRWSYSVKASGIRSLKGGESKRETTGRDQIAYYFWHGRDCSASGKGTSALATIELDSDKSPQIMVDEGHESACFLNMFDGQMIVHHGKQDEAKSIAKEDNVLMYCVHHEDEREISLTQVEARSSNLRSRSSFVVVVVDQVIGVCVWHGCKSTPEKRQGSLRGAKRLASWFQGIFDVKTVDMVEVEEGHEGTLFWEALNGKDEYGSLNNVSGKCDNRVRLFTFLSTEGPFLAREILNPTRGEHVAPYPFRQAALYEATQPALFLVDAVNEMYLWQGWWPGSPEESESATTTGSAEFRWHRDRKLAMQSIQSYADIVGRQMSKAYVVNAGLEPTEFRALFPFWEDHPDVTKINSESGKLDGARESMTGILAKLSRDRYTLAELLVRPLPEGVDPSKMEMYLSDAEFQEVFNTTKDEFTKLPKWKKLEQRKKVGLF